MLIVLHHLISYGPLSDAAFALMPGVTVWLYTYGRMAVQAFLVIGGFLAAAQLAPSGAPPALNPLRAIGRRYVRLAKPYVTALALAVACAAYARPWMSDDSAPDAPGLFQLLAHLFFLQDLLGYEALSAGVWYVAIDFQLFALMVLSLWAAGRVEQQFPKLKATAPAIVFWLAVASLFMFNRDSAWDKTALYFFGSYGLGALGYWASTARDGLRWLALLCMLAILALLVEFRERIAVATVIMLVLVLGSKYRVLQWASTPRWMRYLGRISYSIFLVHYPLGLAVNAVYSRYFPDHAVTDALGLMLSVGVSVAGGALFFHWIENRHFRKNARTVAA